MGPSFHFYSCKGLIISDTGILQVDGLSTRHLGVWGVTAWYQSLGIQIPRARWETGWIMHPLCI